MFSPYFFFFFFCFQFTLAHSFDIKIFKINQCNETNKIEKEPIKRKEKAKPYGYFINVWKNLILSHHFLITTQLMCVYFFLFPFILFFSFKFYFNLTLALKVIYRTPVHWMEWRENAWKHWEWIQHPCEFFLFMLELNIFDDTNIVLWNDNLYIQVRRYFFGKKISRFSWFLIQ